MGANPFMLAMAVLNVAAAGWYLHVSNPKLAAVVFCYGITSAILATV